MFAAETSGRSKSDPKSKVGIRECFTLHGVDNSNLREDQKKAIRELSMLVSAAYHALETDDPEKAQSLLGEAISILILFKAS